MSVDRTIDDTAQDILDIKDKLQDEKNKEEYRVKDIIGPKEFKEYNIDKSYNVGNRRNKSIGSKEDLENDNLEYGYIFFSSEYIDEDEKCIKLVLEKEYDTKSILINLDFIDNLDIDPRNILYNKIRFVYSENPHPSYIYIIEEDELQLIDGILSYNSALKLSILTSGIISILFLIGFVFNILSLSLIYPIIIVFFSHILPWIFYRYVNHKY
jgi:hypothetical protein